LPFCDSHFANRILFAELIVLRLFSKTLAHIFLTLCRCTWLLQPRIHCLLPLFGPDQTLMAEIRSGAIATRSLFIGKLLDLFAHSLPCSNWFICEIFDVLWLLFFVSLNLPGCATSSYTLLFRFEKKKYPCVPYLCRFRVVCSSNRKTLDKQTAGSSILLHLVLVPNRTFSFLYFSVSVEGSQSVAFVCNLSLD